MSPVLAANPFSPLAAYSRNVTKSIAGWNVALSTGRQPSPLVSGEPLRALCVEGEDLVVESGEGPGRPHRHVLAGPLTFTRHQRGTTLELRLTGPHDASYVLALSPN